MTDETFLGVNQDHLKLFLDALRSGRFRQAAGSLTEYAGTNKEAHCCLGVATVVAMENGLELRYEDQGMLRYYPSGESDIDPDRLVNCTVLPYAVQQWYGWPCANPLIQVQILNGETGEPKLAKYGASIANDELHCDFATIADGFERTYRAPVAAES
jgi:hypothetical protein